jgi:hypothetical protein
MMENDYVVVGTVHGQFAEAQLRGFLESKGIPTQVRGETLRTALPVSIDGLGAVDILVPRDRADAALELIERADHGDFSIPAGQDPE